MTVDRLSPPNTAKGQLQRELLNRLDVHEREGTLPTSARFLFYELVQLGVVPKTKTGGQHRPVFATTTTRAVAALAVRAVTRELDYATWR
jgi:hypothetical protein